MLKAKILSLSESEEWDSAKEEWMFVHLYKKRYGKCPCNHYPITNHCVIKNQENGNEMFLGNCCIKHISEAQHKRAQKIWQIFRDPNVRANQDLIDHAFSQGYITEHEKNIYEALPKRKRNDIQKKKLLKLNLKIIRNWDAEKTKCEMDPLHTVEIHYSDQALYYKCNQCDYKIKFHESKKKSEEDEMEEEFDDDDVPSPESSSEEEYVVSQDETFIISQSIGEDEEEEDGLDENTSEDEESLTDDDDEEEDSSSEDGEDYIPVEYNFQEKEEEDINEAFTIVKIIKSHRNGEQRSNQQQLNSDKFIYGKDGEATYQ